MKVILLFILLAHLYLYLDLHFHRITSWRIWPNCSRVLLPIRIHAIKYNHKYFSGKRIWSVCIVSSSVCVAIWRRCKVVNFQIPRYVCMMNISLVPFDTVRLSRRWFTKLVVQSGAIAGRLIQCSDCAQFYQIEMHCHLSWYLNFIAEIWVYTMASCVVSEIFGTRPNQSNPIQFTAFEFRSACSISKDEI